MARIGMRHVVAAPISTETSGSAIEYGTGVVDGHGTQGIVNWQRSDNPLYGDDVIVENDNGPTGYTLEIGVTEMLETVEATVLGYVADTTDTGAYEITDAAAPYCGSGYVQVIRRKGVTKYKAVWFHKAQFGISTEETRTKQQTIEWGTPVMTGQGLGVYIDNSGKAKFRRQKMFDTEAAAVTWLNGLANIT